MTYSCPPLLVERPTLGINAMVAVEPGREHLAPVAFGAAGHRYSCSTVNWSYGMLPLNASITQLRQGHWLFSRSLS